MQEHTNAPKDMRQPNSFEEQGNSVPLKEEKDTRQPNSFQEQPPNMDNEHTKKRKEDEGSLMDDTISKQEDNVNK